MDNIMFLLETFPHAVAGGLIIAAACSLLGVFVILKRMVFIGITLSQVAVFGVASGLVLGIHPYVGAILLSTAAVIVLSYPLESARIPRDALLGVMFTGASALSILIVSQSGFGLHEVQGMFYGDLIFTTPLDLAVIAGVLTPIILYIFLFLRPTLNTFMDREASRVLGIRTRLWELLFFLALGLAISVSSRTAGSLLVFCYLVVPPSAALLLSRRFGAVLMFSVLFAMGATFTGLYAGARYDLPTNHIVAAAAVSILTAVFLGTFTFSVFRPAGGGEKGGGTGLPN